MIFMKWLLFFVIGYSLILITHQQSNESLDDDDNDDDECAFISGQHCDQNGICKYCAMCLQSSCILSKTINANNSNTNCNATQFGTTNLYNWYDYCLSSENDMSGSYCATSTECYQYRKSAGPTITYAWHNLTCNPNTCMLIASDGAPPPVPIPPQQPTSNDANTNRTRLDTSHHINHSYYHDRSPLHNPTAIALTVICCLVIFITLCWVIRFGKKKGWFLSKYSHQPSIASVPSTAPPSFSTIPPEMRQTVRSSSSSQGETLPSYLSPYSYPPKYEQAIVTQIRGLRDESSSSSAISDHHTVPSMWVPVYFTNQHGRRGPELFGFTPSQPTYWIHPSSLQQRQPQNPFDDRHSST